MRCFLAVLLILSLCGCGGARFQATFRSNTQFSITGVILFVDFVPILNSPFAVTSITFLPDFIPATTVSFCGDLTQQLFPNDFATVTFTQGSNCDTVLTIFVDCCRKSANHFQTLFRPPNTGCRYVAFGTEDSTVCFRNSHVLCSTKIASCDVPILSLPGLQVGRLAETNAANKSLSSEDQATRRTMKVLRGLKSVTWRQSNNARTCV